MVVSLTASGSIEDSRLENAGKIRVFGDRAYVMCSNQNDRMVMIDISNPVSPVISGTIVSAAIDGAFDMVEVEKSGTKYAIVSAANANQVVVYNVTDMGNPSLVTTIPFDAPRGMKLKQGENYVFVASSSADKNVVALDIKDPANPVPTGWSPALANKTPTNLGVHGSRIFVGGTGNGAYALDGTMAKGAKKRGQIDIVASSASAGISSHSILARNAGVGSSNLIADANYFEAGQKVTAMAMRSNGSIDKVGESIFLGSPDYIEGQAGIVNEKIYITNWGGPVIKYIQIDPSDYGDCKIWLRSESIGLNDDDKVTKWRNERSDPGYLWDFYGGVSDSFQPAVESKKPAFKENILAGFPVVRFDGSQQQRMFRYPSSWDAGYPQMAWDTTWFVVGIPRGNCPPFGGFIGRVGGDIIRYDSLFKYARLEFYDYNSSNSAATFDEPVLITIRSKVGEKPKMWINGVLETTSSITKVIHSVNYLWGLGGTSNYYNQWATLDIAEIIGYDGYILDNDLDEINNYCLNKYEIPI